MLPHKLRLAFALFLVPFLTVSQIPMVQADQAQELCTPVLTRPSSGPATITALGSKLSEVARSNGLTSTQLRSLLSTAPTFHLDICGQAFYAESMDAPEFSPLPIQGYANSSLITVNNYFQNASIRLNASGVLTRHSKPGSSKTIYLDFDGEKIDNTSWNKNFNGGATWTALGFSTDNDYASFNESELQVIQSVWMRVAEDFALFDVDVTTEQPKTGILERTDANDQIYGTRVLISNDSVIFNSCKCSGLAYISTFDAIGTLHDLNQPAWVFTQGVGSNAKFIAEAITHEVGHTLGLSHDGTKLSAYYAGVSGWAPIMGVGFYQPLTQWSKGEYADANNLEDDIAIMKSHGLNLNPDEDDNTEKTARVIKETQSLGGIITNSADFDYFKFTPATTDEYTISATPATLSANLDILMTVYPSGKANEKLDINPPKVPNGNDLIDGLSASLTKTFTAGVTYVIIIDGASEVESASNTSANYGSVGTYKISIVKGKAPISTATVSPTLSTDSNASIADKLVLPKDLPTGASGLVLPYDKQNSSFLRCSWLLVM